MAAADEIETKVGDRVCSAPSNHLSLENLRLIRACVTAKDVHSQLLQRLQSDASSPDAKAESTTGVFNLRPMAERAEEARSLSLSRTLLNTLLPFQISTLLH